MNEHNQLKLKPGPYEHYKVNGDGSHPIYIVESVVTHMQEGGVWKKLHDPLVVYRNLETQFDVVNGSKVMVVKNFARPLSEFNSDVEVDGVTLKRFKPI